jgi:hypothetical protein
MPSDDVRLNSLDAFTKKSPRFILEEHGGGEVPAGCGGVVLRWINPAAAEPHIRPQRLSSVCDVRVGLGVDL